MNCIHCGTTIMEGLLCPNCQQINDIVKADLAKREEELEALKKKLEDALKKYGD